MVAVGDILVGLENRVIFDIRAKYFIYFLSTLFAYYFDLTKIINIRNLSEMVEFKADLISEVHFSHGQSVHFNK